MPKSAPRLYHGVIIPSQSTLRKYGLHLDEWKAMLLQQDGVCAVCKKLPKKKRLVIDHEHVYRWKKMPDAERKKYVRGLLCWFCNSRYLSRGITIEKLENALTYMKNYQSRRM